MICVQYILYNQGHEFIAYDAEVAISDLLVAQRSGKASNIELVWGFSWVLTTAKGSDIVETMTQRVARSIKVSINITSR